MSPGASGRDGGAPQLPDRRSCPLLPPPGLSASEDAGQKERKRGSDCCAPGPREGGARGACPAGTRGSAAEFAQFPSLLLLLPLSSLAPSLSPPLTSPSAVPSFLGTPPPGIAFFVLELASRWRRRGAASAGGGGWGRSPPRSPARRTDKPPAAPSTRRSSLCKLLLSVCGHARPGGWGSRVPRCDTGFR